jgi:alpha-L-fucosidase 2
VVWTEFWAQSGVRLSEAQLQKWWYRMVYYFRCFAKQGATGVGLKTSFDGLAGWHNSYKFNYNIQQTYLSAGPINHPELVEPIIDVLANYWPRARWFARNCFIGCEGAFVHSDVFHPHEPDPAQCKTRNQHQFAYIPWGYTLGMQGHICFLMWEYYQYKPDVAYLREKTYPMIKDIALFYCSFIEKCQKDDKGKYIIGPSYFPENFHFGQDNVAYDLPYISYALKAAREAATILKTDEALVKRINAVLAAMPYYETVPDPNQDNQPIVTHWKSLRPPEEDCAC